MLLVLGPLQCKLTFGTFAFGPSVGPVLDFQDISICYFHKPACAQRAPEGKIWPVPLPFPEMHVKKSNRRQVDAPRKLALNYVILILNWLFLGQGPWDAGSHSLGTKLNKSQWQTVIRFQPLVDSWNSHDIVDPAAMGRSAAKVENIEGLLLELESLALEPAAEVRAYLPGKT